MSQSVNHAYYHSIGKEDYEELKACLGQTFQEINDLKAEGISIDGEHLSGECCLFSKIN